METSCSSVEKKETLPPVSNAVWERPPQDNYGYTSDDERRAKRGLEEWEMLGDHLPHEQGVNTRRWIHFTIWPALIITVVVYFLGVEIEPADEQQWYLDTFKEEIFAVIFFFVLLYVSLIFKLIYDNKREAKKVAEVWVITGVFGGVLLAIILGVIQVFFGYLL